MTLDSRVDINSTEQQQELVKLIDKNKNTTEKKNNVKQTLFILAKSFIASGVLFLPKAFLRGGLVFSPVFIFVINFVCIYSFLKVFKVFVLLKLNFGDMAAKLYGRWLKILIQSCVVLSQLGFCCSYFSFLQQNLGTIIDTHTKINFSILEWILILLACWTPFVMIRKITKFAYTSLIADGCIIVGLMYLYIYCSRELITKGPETTLHLINFNTLGVCIGTAVFAFEGVNMVVPIAESMERPEKFPICLSSVMSSVAFILASMGSIGYATFGENIAEIITLNLPNGGGQIALIIIYSFAVFFTLPLMFFPAMQILEPLIWNRENFEKFTKNKMFWMQNIVRFLVLAFVALVSFVARSNLTNFISIVGSCTGGPLCFIFPPLLHIKAIAITKLDKFFDIILLIFGFVVFVFTLYESIVTW